MLPQQASCDLISTLLQLCSTLTLTQQLESWTRQQWEIKPQRTESFVLFVRTPHPFIIDSVHRISCEGSWSQSQLTVSKMLVVEPRNAKNRFRHLSKSKSIHFAFSSLPTLFPWPLLWEPLIRKGPSWSAYYLQVLTHCESSLSAGCFEVIFWQFRMYRRINWFCMGVTFSPFGNILMP